MRKNQSIIKGRSVFVREGDDINKCLRKLKKKMEESKVLEEVRNRQAYEKPSSKRKKAQASAKARYKKKLEKEKLSNKPY